MRPGSILSHPLQLCVLLSFRLSLRSFQLLQFLISTWLVQFRALDAYSILTLFEPIQFS
jgi:hypothetical protein